MLLFISGEHKIGNKYLKSLKNFSNLIYQPSRKKLFLVDILGALVFGLRRVYLSTAHSENSKEHQIFLLFAL